ncbi:hypothetical protein GCM10009654_25030 [Streptomyces hebeiensis]|uniref:HNH nuclease domain-containing protein n=1 Tax=Streptomyces hebeiensis TaxID=229486 RepID=A0ABP4FFC3_9ACTN
MALTDISRSEVLSAVEEYDHLGRDAFLSRYGFRPAVTYMLAIDGRQYDSKAIVGAAHGCLPGQAPLAPSEFSGGRDHAAKLLGRLGFEVVHLAAPDATTEALVDRVWKLRVNHAESGPRLYQPIALLWAMGRAFRGEPRVLPWDETSAALNQLLMRHGQRGEAARPHYPVASLYHSGLWSLQGHTGSVPLAHDNSGPRRWFAEHRPAGGLTAPVHKLMRDSGEARVKMMEAIVGRFFGRLDEIPLLEEVGLHVESVTDDATGSVPATATAIDGPSAAGRPPGDGTADGRDQGRGSTADMSPMLMDPVARAAQYEKMCTLVALREEFVRGRRRERVVRDPVRSGWARKAVLLRSEGLCENPKCTGQPDDVTDGGEPILEVDHIVEIARGGPDHPSQMIALCPNCHAVKTRGRTRYELSAIFLRVARERHMSTVTEPESHKC